MSGYLWSSDRSVRGHSREHVPAECLSRNVIMYGLTVCTWGGLYLSRNEKKAAFSFYSSPSIYNGWVTWRKGLIKKKGSYLLLPMKRDQTNCTKVYKQYPLAWELDLSRSDISPGLVQQWML